MHNKDRYIQALIEEYLSKRMVFVGGPRQVGKTTLCISFLKPPQLRNPNYLNWDDLGSKKILRNGELPSAKLIVIDEIHKFKNWRNLLKGFYDKRQEGSNFLVTGSARLDYYRRGGDSLFGRYRYIRLHPFSVSELNIKNSSDLNHLLKFGGFPEPYFSGSEKNHKLWCRERLHKIVNDDIRDLESVREFNSIETLAESLPERVSAPLSVRSLAEDLQVSPHTVERWIDILEKVYYCFRIAPYGSPKIRAVKKEKKLYLWDWSTLKNNPGAQFENLVASHLLKYCNYIEDSEGDEMELRYLRDTDLREMDFVVLKNKKPIFAVECKTGERQLSKHLLYFKERTSIPHFYQVHLGEKDYVTEKNIRVLPFIKFCDEVGLV